MENMGEDIGMLCSDSDNCLPEEMATPSKRPKLTEQSKEKETNDFKYQLEKQKVEIQELKNQLDFKNQLDKQKVENQDLKNQLAYQKEKVREKDESLKVKEETIAELKSLLATEDCLKKQLATQRDKIQKKYDILKCPLDHVPDEVQLSIFKFLGTEDLISCAHVSKRLRRICQDESLWEKVDLNSKLVPSEFIEQILENGCKYINLNGAKIVGGLELSRNDYDVKYLNLDDCIADQGVLEKLISSCKSLEKLSLCFLNLNSNVMESLNNQKLQTLDLTLFKGLNLELMTDILRCEKLTDVSFRLNRHLSNDLVQYLVENLPSNIEKLSLSAIGLTDEHVKTLVKRCKKITDLELSKCRNITEDSLTSIVEHAKQLVKLNVSDANIGISLVQGRNSYLKVKSMPNLKVLLCTQESQYNGPRHTSQETENLRKLMPHLEINKKDDNCLYYRTPCLNIALPNNWNRQSHDDGLWDIYVKTIELFPNRFDYARQGKKSKWGDKMNKIPGMMS